MTAKELYDLCKDALEIAGWPEWTEHGLNYSLTWVGDSFAYYMRPSDGCDCMDDDDPFDMKTHVAAALIEKRLIESLVPQSESLHLQEYAEEWTVEVGYGWGILGRGPTLLEALCDAHVRLVVKEKEKP